MDSGIKEIKELLVFIALLINASDKATKDGLGLEDVALFMPALLKAPEAFSGMANMGVEFKDLSMEEVKELEMVLAKELDLEDDKLEGLVEKSLGLLVQTVALIKEIKSLKK